jgi:galactose oxidase
VFSPPYLFKPDGSSATRPVIEKWPETISYGGNFDIVVEGDPSQIASVALLRSDHNTHSLTTGDRYVKLAFHQKGSSEGRELRVRAAKVPAQAVPGIYMLFVVDKNGVPSEGRRLDIVLQN